MRYLGWVVALIFAIILYYIYSVKYQPLSKKITKLEDEIKMWEETVKDHREITGDRNRFPPERFFKDNRLTPYGEVEILRNLDRNYKGIEIYISAPRALERAGDLLRFLSEQRIDYYNLYIIAVADSVERFEYKYTK
ncbi:MAG: hypothetical protein ABIL70_01470 [candidate division WOR-3 bacterium]